MTLSFLYKIGYPIFFLKDINRYSILMLKSNSLIHGKEGEDKAKVAAYALFTGEGDDSNMPTAEISASEIPE